MSAPARAQEFGVTVAPYVWFTGMKSKITIAGNSVKSSSSFIDTVRDTETALGFSGFGAIHYGNWSLFLDGLWTQVTDDPAIAGRFPTKLRVTTGLLDFGVSYRIDLSTAAPGTPGWNVAIEPYIGGRWLSTTVKLEGAVFGPLGFVTLPFTVKRSASGVDPILGARLGFVSNDGWRVMFGGDVGGFGASSEFTWSAIGLVGHQFTLLGMNTTAYVGYKATAFDLERGGSAPFKANIVFHGPMVGASLRF
jgi:hypothetical protein